MLGLFRQAGWAPTTVFLVHVYASCVLDAYVRHAWLDLVMHVAGGIAIAFFFDALIQRIEPRIRRSLRFVTLFAMTGTAGVLWEFAEYLSDRWFGTRAQLALDDTLLDMALGIAGGLLYLACVSSTRRA
jgi:TRAP-type C4-dicarboxylate transport system permease small subunit